MATTYTPDDPETARLFAQYKKALETVRDLKPKIRERAGEELHRGATVGQLASATGETPEVFRRIARKLGVERKREPTVGPLKAQSGSKASDGSDG